jgi:hypothetical protein
MTFEDLPHLSVDDVEAAIQRDNPEELLNVPLVVSLSSPDFAWAQGICIQLARHPHANVRGNAIEGFGHLARRFRQLDQGNVKPLIEKALLDTNSYIKGKAVDAADDVTHFLEWEVVGHAGK